MGSRELRVTMIGDARRAIAEFNKVEGKLSKLGSAVSKLGKPALGIGAAIGGATFKFAQLGDEIQKMSLRTGFSTETLSELRFAADQSGASLDLLNPAIRRIQRTVEGAAEGNVAFTKALDSVGLAVTDLQGLNPEEQFLKILNAVGGLEDQNERTAASFELLGDSGVTLLPLVDAGAEGLAAMRQEARDLGIVLDQETANKAAAFNDGVNRVRETLNSMVIEIGSTAAPALTGLADTFTALPGPIQKIVAAIGVAAVGAKLGLLPSLSSMVGFIGKAVLPAIRSIGLALLTPPLGFVVALAAAGVAIFVFRDEIVEGFTKIKDFIVGALSAVVGFLRNHWPEVATLLSGPFALVVALATDAFGVRSALVSAFEFVRDRIFQIFGAVVQFFKGLPGRLAGVGKGIANAIIDGLNAGIQIINDVIPNKISIPVLPDIDLPDNPLPRIPHLAAGARDFPGGLAVLGERGPELVSLPRGTDVFSAGETRRMMSDRPAVQVTVQALDPAGAADAVVAVLTELQRTGRISEGTLIV